MRYVKINKGHTMCYEISNEEWKICKICNKSIQDLKNIYGGSGIYYTQVFKKHLVIDHNTTLQEYFSTNLSAPKCPCNICDKDAKIIIKGSIFRWGYVCGRTPGTMKWSEKAKISRLGKNNPMYGKSSWNKNLTSENNEILRMISEKRIGQKSSLETKMKQSESAKKRKIHGHTGKKHSEETKEKYRQNTLNMIKQGKFKQTVTKPHIEMIKILNNLNITFEEEKICHYWCFDFYLPMIDLYIEVDGDYFHSNPKIYPEGPKTKTQKINYTRDIAKNNFCNKNNLILLRFWESDILNNPESIECTLKKYCQ